MRLGLIRMADPLTLTLSPNTEYVLEERREELVGMPPRAAREATAVSQLLPRACPGCNPSPRWGAMKKKRPPAASQISSLQTQYSSLPGPVYTHL